MSKIVHIGEFELKRMCTSIFVNGVKHGKGILKGGEMESQDKHGEAVHEGIQCFKDHLMQFEHTKHED